MRKRFEALWSIRSEAVMTVVRLMSRDMAAQESTASALDASATFAAQFGSAGTPRSIGPDSVAIIPVQGILTNDGPATHGSTYKAIGDAAEKAAANPDVQRIILHVDSPGGEVTGLPETAALLSRVNKIKPISAIVGGAAASAAYWLTSQASDITLTPSGEVGSVGVRMMHVDMSKMLENEGYRVTELHSGSYKTEWSPYTRLTKDAQVDMQKRLDASHRQFLAAVSSGRGLRTSSAMRQSSYGNGRMLSSKAALNHGLVDRLQSVRDFYKGGTPFGVTTSTQAARANLDRMRAAFTMAR